MWAVVSSFSQTFNMPLNEVLYNISYANLVMYSNTAPIYDLPQEQKPTAGKSKKVTPTDFFNQFKKQ